MAGASGRGRGEPEGAGLLLSHVGREPGDADPAAARESVNAFGFDLLGAYLGAARGNVVVSPWSIVTALAMVRAGARGSTAGEIDRVLHIGSPTVIDASLNALSLQLAARNGSFPGRGGSLAVELTVADRAFAQKGVTFSEPFLEILARYYGAGVGVVDFAGATEGARRAVNEWVSEETRARIPELLVPGALDVRTRLVLVNAVYLDADWAFPFDRAATRDAPFHAPGGDVTTPFMRNQARYGYAKGDGWVAVTLPYAGDALAMTIVLPDEGRFDSVAHEVAAVLAAAASRSTRAWVDLAVPKFDIAFISSLRERLRELGMPGAFDPDGADFGGMTDDDRLYVSDVVHGANLTVDEKGTVAAAATAAIMLTRSMVVEAEPVTVDRPFLFALHDGPTGAVLFEGQVTKPVAPG